MMGIFTEIVNVLDVWQGPKYPSDSYSGSCYWHWTCYIIVGGVEKYTKS